MYGLTDDELKINQLGTNSVRPNRADLKKQRNIDFQQ